MNKNITSFNQKGGVTAEKVTLNRSQKEKKSWLNNPWLVTIAGGVILATILYVIYGQF